MATKKQVTQENKQAMIEHGSWGAFCAERDELKKDGPVTVHVVQALINKYLPKPGQEPLPNAGKRPVYTWKEREKAKYDEAMEGKVFSEIGAELHAPGELNDDGQLRSGADASEKAPGDFDGGDMGDIGDGAVVDDNEDHSVLDHVEGVEEFEGQKGGMRFEAQLRWVIAHIDDDNVKLKKHAPHPMAWTYLSTCRKSASFKEKFLLTFGPKLLPKNVGDDKPSEDDSYDGDNLVDALTLVKNTADKARGKIGSV